MSSRWEEGRKLKGQEISGQEHSKGDACTLSTYVHATYVTREVGEHGTAYEGLYKVDESMVVK